MTVENPLSRGGHTHRALISDGAGCYNSLAAENSVKHMAYKHAAGIAKTDQKRSPACCPGPHRQTRCSVKEQVPLASALPSSIPIAIRAKNGTCSKEQGRQCLPRCSDDKRRVASEET